MNAHARDFAPREAGFDSWVDRQIKWTTASLQAAKRGQSYEALDRINSQHRARKPSFVGAGLKIAAGGVNAYSKYKKTIG
jgi:hypothetical protein